jgi:hypothetical protein
MRKPIHVRSWKDADAWVLVHGLQGADVIIRLNSRSFLLDHAIPQFGDSYDHCPWRAVNDAHHEPSNLAWQIFREKIDAGAAWRLVPVLVATRAIVEGEELFRDYTNVRYRSHLPSTSDEFDFEEADAPWVHAALDHLALECQEELDDLLLPDSFVPSSPSSLSEITVSSSHLAESMEDSDFVSDSVAHFFRMLVLLLLRAQNHLAVPISSQRWWVMRTCRVLVPDGPVGGRRDNWHENI